MTIFAKVQTSAAFIILSLGAANADTLKFSVAAEPYPPFASINSSGAWAGFEVDLANAVCAAEKLDCQIVATSFDGLIPALLSGKIDVIFASMVITEERAKTISFSIPYYNTAAAWVGNKVDNFTLTPQGLKGKLIGVQSATVHFDYVTKYLVPAGANIKIYQTQDDANSDLANARIDLTLADSAGEDAFLATDAGKCCETKAYADKNDPVFGSGIGAGFRPGDTELRAKVDAGIREVYKNGTFSELQKKYFSYDIGTPPKD